MKKKKNYANENFKNRRKIQILEKYIHKLFDKELDDESINSNLKNIGQKYLDTIV